MKILLVDQFSGPSPYQVQQAGPISFETFCADALAAPCSTWRKPKVLEVEESYDPPDCTTTWRADEAGNAVPWKCRWDSSG